MENPESYVTPEITSRPQKPKNLQQSALVTAIYDKTVTKDGIEKITIKTPNGGIEVEVKKHPVPTTQRTEVPKSECGMNTDQRISKMMSTLDTNGKQIKPRRLFDPMDESMEL
jgi:hypothetical protein